MEDSEPENALAYLDLYDREPVITHGGSLLTRVEWVEHRGLSVAIGQVWTGCRNLGEERPRWIWTSCEKYTGRTAHGRFSMPNAATARIAVENTLGNAADHMLERVKEETEKARSEGTQHANLAKFLGVN